MPTRPLLHAAALDADPSLLHAAADWGQRQTVRLLLDRGADPNPGSASYGRWTPLQIAIHRDHPPVAKLLLAHGVRLDALDKYGRTPAAAQGYPDIVDFLIDQGADPNAGFPLNQARPASPDPRRQPSHHRRSAPRHPPRMGRIPPPARRCPTPSLLARLTPSTTTATIPGASRQS